MSVPNPHDYPVPQDEGQRSSYMAKKCKRIMFTYNLEPEEVFIMPQSPYIKRAVFQEEMGTHRHIQGYLELTQARRLSWVKKLFGDGHPHVSKARSNSSVCYTYCQKPETRVEGGQTQVIGDWSDVGQGARTDLTELYAACKKKRTISEVYEEFPAASIRYFKSVNGMFEHWHSKSRKMDEPYMFLWYCGEAGTGKSHKAHSMAPEAKLYYKDLEGSNWWDGLNSEHTHLILEDYEGTGITYGQLKRIADKYPLKVQVKGGYRDFHLTKVIVTSNKWPWQLWRDHEIDPMDNPNGLVTPIMRRFTFWKFERDHHHRPGKMTLYWKPDLIKTEMLEEPDSPITPPHQAPIVDLTQSDSE